MHVIQDIQFCATIDRFCSAIRRRRKKRDRIRSLMKRQTKKNNEKKAKRMNIVTHFLHVQPSNSLCLFILLLFAARIIRKKKLNQSIYMILQIEKQRSIQSRREKNYLANFPF